MSEVSVASAGGGYGSCEEWHCPRLSALPMPLVRLQFHNDAAVWQAAFAMKALALLLYAMGNVSFGSIARILGVSDVAVLELGLRRSAQASEPSTKVEVVVVTLDEMWHFVKKN